MFTPLISHAAQELRDYCLLIVDAIDRRMVSARSAMDEVLETGLGDLLLDIQPHSSTKPVLDAQAASRPARINAVADYLVDHHENRLSLPKTRIRPLAALDARGLTENVAFDRRDTSVETV